MPVLSGSLPQDKFKSGTRKMCFLRYKKTPETGKDEFISLGTMLQSRDDSIRDVYSTKINIVEEHKD